MKLPTGNQQMIRLHILSAQDLINRAKEIVPDPDSPDWFNNGQKILRKDYLKQAESQLTLAEAYLI
jgi:hypothetical protein